MWGNMRNPKILKRVFYALTVIGLLVAMQFFVPSIRELFRGSMLFLVPSIVFSLLGLILIILTMKEKQGSKLKKFLIWTGIFSAGFFVSILLHNLFYAISILAKEIFILKYLMEILHIGFFIIAIFVCPIGFLISVARTIILFGKPKHTSKR